MKRVNLFFFNFSEDTHNSGKTDGSSDSHHHTNNLLRPEGHTWSTAQRRRHQVSKYVMGQSNQSVNQFIIIKISVVLGDTQ